MNNPSVNSGQRLPSGTVTFLFTDTETDIEGSRRFEKRKYNLPQKAKVQPWFK